jgi:hypothetical protein
LGSRKFCFVHRQPCFCCTGFMGCQTAPTLISAFNLPQYCLRNISIDSTQRESITSFFATKLGTS